MNKVLRVIYVGLIFSTFLACNFNSTFASATKQFYCHGGTHEVERAGMLLVKKYGPKDYAILVGHDAKENFWNFPGGGCESQKDKYTSQAAAREVKEETGGAVDIPGGKVSKLSSVYSVHNKIQLFIYRDDNLSVMSLTQACQKACANKRLPRGFREVDEYRAIPVQNILAACDAIIASKFSRYGQHYNNYVVLSRNGSPTKIEHHYLDSLARDPSFRTKIERECDNTQF